MKDLPASLKHQGQGRARERGGGGALVEFRIP